MRRRAWRDGTVSAVGFGCMSFGGFYGPTNEAESMRAVATALDLGVDFWDTANVYGDGLCEQVIGKFLAEDKNRRARVTLATKFAIRRRDNGSRFFDNSAIHIREALDESRKRLGVDYIDLYYVHRVDNSVPIEDTVGELARLVKEGAIGAIGLSESAPDTLRRAHDVHPIAAVQLPPRHEFAQRLGLAVGHAPRGRMDGLGEVGDRASKDARLFDGLCAAASRRSVLASLPVERAKSRI
jgi:aryl-alcohol dehydrogenase-like predicted oxidoreductase